MANVIVISGVPGAGKTRSMEALSDEMGHAGIAHGAIDVDYLCQVMPSEENYGATLAFENLAAMWPNYKRRGINTMVLARVVETPEEVDKYRAAFEGAMVTVIRVTADQALIDERLAKREYGDWIVRMQQRSRELAPILAEAGVEAFTLDITSMDPREVGRALFTQLQTRGLFGDQGLDGY